MDAGRYEQVATKRQALRAVTPLPAVFVNHDSSRSHPGGWQSVEDASMAQKTSMIPMASGGRLGQRIMGAFAAVQATFSDVHPFCDQIVQSSTDARDKGKPGWTGRKACVRHVATYSAGRIAAAVGVTRALGHRAS